MNITLTIPDSAISAEKARVDQYNAGSGQQPVTIEQFAQLERDEVTAQRLAQYHAAARAAMTPIADAMIAGSEALRTRVLGYAAAEIAKEQNA